MKILIITPMLKEFHSAREVFGAVEKDFPETFRLAKIFFKVHEIHLLQCGFCVEDAMAAYEDTFGIPDLLVDTGSCGSLKEGLLLGTIVQGKVLLKENESLFHSPPIYINDPDVQYVRLLEVENAVMNEEDKKIYQIRADVCTMESYRIFSKSIEWNCRFLSLRVVTDHADAQGSSDFKRNIRPFSMKLYAFLKDFLMNISH
ncbi:hypothetical protein [Oceanispirochaeta sp.]|uniref:hypothetical protein n=1 Tax=Oceanispirochaeta sp. TaxID=2035350 RepID=UPI00260DA3C0|nr:hypothetical protein [Oceanispirochaeta sp.]MDA3956227.1 hypothetical protein [Oceanispirochaeta sp.]